MEGADQGQPRSTDHDKGINVSTQIPRAGMLQRTGVIGRRRQRYSVYIPDNYEPSRRWPVILFLHGSGERGADGVAPTTLGLGPAVLQHPERFPALVVFPQALRGMNWRGQMLDGACAALEDVIDAFNGDTDRIYLTGISMGGYGAVRLALQEPDRFAALVPVCGGIELPETVVNTDAEDPANVAARLLRHLPVWAFHGSDDPVIPVNESRRFVQALEAAGADVHYSEFAGVGHGSWDQAYATPELWSWLFMQRRTSR